MNKQPTIAIILDSMASLSQNDLAKLGFAYIYQQVILDTKAYADGVDLVLKSDKAKIFAARDFKTSLPPLEVISETFTTLSKTYDYVVFLPMHKGLSGTYSAAASIAKDFPNVYVLELNLLTSSIIQAGTVLRKDVQNGMDFKAAVAKIKKTSDQSQIFLAPHSVERLIKSGRLTGIKRVILEKARIVPLIHLTEEGFKVSGMKRSQARSIESAVRKTIENIGGAAQISKYHFEIVHCGDQEAIDVASKIFRENGITEFKTVWTNTAVAGHVGEKAIATNAYLKLD